MMTHPRAYLSYKPQLSVYFYHKRQWKSCINYLINSMFLFEKKLITIRRRQIAGAPNHKEFISSTYCQPNTGHSEQKEKSFKKEIYWYLRYLIQTRFSLIYSITPNHSNRRYISIALDLISGFRSSN